MGSYLKSAPTPENIVSTIAKLKPHKYAQWKERASRKGLSLEEYAIARIAKKWERKRRGGEEMNQSATPQQTTTGSKRKRENSVVEEVELQSSEFLVAPKATHDDANAGCNNNDANGGEQRSSPLPSPQSPTTENLDLERPHLSHDQGESVSPPKLGQAQMHNGVLLTPAPSSIPDNNSLITEAEHAERPQLPLPLATSRSIDPYVRARSRRERERAKAAEILARAASSEDQVPLVTPQTETHYFTADPSRLQDNKGKYYCVRRGWHPGIYYSWNEAEAQVLGFKKSAHQAVKNSSMAKAEAENYMNHSSKDCRYSSCAVICQEAARAEATAQRDPPSPSKKDKDTIRNSAVPDDPAELVDYGCGKCGSPTQFYSYLCDDCHLDAEAWFDFILSKHNLVDEQARVLQKVAEGKNVFFTGAAGTGKSTVVHAVKEYLRGTGVSIACTAPTGIASINVSGTTLHTYAGWDGSIDREPLEESCGKRAHMKLNWKRFDETDVIIIDEISMISSNSFTRLSQMMQSAAAWRGGGRHKQPFGGVQVIVSGDFYQLPPVAPFKNCLYCGEEMQRLGERSKSSCRCSSHGEFEDDEKWSFASPIWSKCAFATVELVQVHRQTDPHFANILHDCRKGIWFTTQQSEDLLNHPHEVNRAEATKLLPTREEAEQINSYRLSQINAQPHIYHSWDIFHWESKKDHPELAGYGDRVDDNDAESPLKILENRHRYPAELELKAGMLVLLLVNLSQGEGLVNGSMGIVLGFMNMTDESMPRVRRGPDDKATHRGQLLGGTYKHYKEAQIHHFRKRNGGERGKWPVVQFKNGLKRLILASCMIHELGKDKPSLLCRTQIPLVAGWALTIHKSQGMTLDSVIVSLARCFERGQAYVALSRARSLKGLIVETLPKPFTTDPIVDLFMENMFWEKSAIKEERKAVISEL